MGRPAERVAGTGAFPLADPSPDQNSHPSRHERAFGGVPWPAGEHRRAAWRPRRHAQLATALP